MGICRGYCLAGGIFTKSYSSVADTGTTYRHIARWSNTDNNWIAIAQFATTWAGGVRALAYSNSVIYAALGSGAGFNYFAKNTNIGTAGTAWQQAGVNGFNGPVYVSVDSCFLQSAILVL